MLRDHTVKKLKREWVPVNTSLPGIKVKRTRSAKEVAMRANILGVFVAIANDPGSVGYFKNLLSEMNMDGALAESERKVLSKGKLTEKEEIDLSWSQESLYAISWCLGIFKEMNSPSKEADLIQMFPGLPPEVELEPFLAKAKLIDKESIVEELEYYYGLQWAIRHPESWSLLNKFKRKKYHLSVIRERRRALEWINDDQLAWDDISLDT